MQVLSSRPCISAFFVVFEMSPAMSAEIGHEKPLGLLLVVVVLYAHWARSIWFAVKNVQSQMFF